MSKLVLYYKDFSKIIRGASHVGLGVTCKETAKVLRKFGINAEAVPVTKPEDVINSLKADINISHAVIGAPWISVDTMEYLLKIFPSVKFAVVSHSNVGFLATEPEAIKLLRGYKKLQEANSNFFVAGNSGKFISAWDKMYNTHVTYLPNLYDIFHDVEFKGFYGNEIKVGIFGSVRPMKNFVSAVAACIYIANSWNKMVNIYMSSGRDEDGGTPNRAIDALVQGLMNVKLNKVIWRDHADFKKVVGEMDLLLQPSYSESFNMVTADGISMGVPSVVSDAITWTPRSWEAKTDSVVSIAEVGIKLLESRAIEAQLGKNKLTEHVYDGIDQWRKFIN